MEDKDKALTGGAWAAGGPAAAGVTAGASFLNTYLQMKAAEEQQRRQLMAQAAQQQAQGETNALNTFLQVARGVYS